MIQPTRAGHLCAAALALTLTAACGGDKKPAESPAAESTTAPESDPVLAQHPEKTPEQSSIRISPRIAEACGLTETETYFAYNSARVSTQASTLLAKLAECFSTGPLKAERVLLVGHTDPRGDDEYNLALGGRRADAVAKGLFGKGLAEDKVETSSRGEMEAKGTDEASWKEDRRVDVKVAQ